jgi:outer membrane lipoprotein-sorting protein
MKTAGVRAFQIVCLVGFVVVNSAAQAPTADKILESVRAKYGSLNSYSDSGEVINEFGTSSKETHKFTTLFNRAPRGYLLDFSKQSGERFVIWGDPDAFHNWWSAINSRTDFPNPNNTGVFTGADVHTLGVAMKVTALLYPKANFQGSFTNFTDVVVDGVEDIGGRKCYRLVGTAKDIYSATGRESNVRRMTVWVDIESMLIRRVVEVPKDVLPGHIDKVTTMFEPQENPKLEESRFAFTPPK